MATDFITLTCPSCGGKLEITKDMDRFACGHCGNEHVVRRTGGTVSLAPVMETLQKVQASTDRVASELAVQRMSTELAEAQARVDAEKAKLKAAELRVTQGNGPVATLINIGLTFAFVIFVLAAIGSFIAASSAGKISDTDGTAYVVVALILGIIVRARWSGNTFLRKARDKALQDVSTAEAAYKTLLDRRDQARAQLGP